MKQEDYKSKVIALLAKELSVPKDNIMEDSGMGDFSNWDSVGHFKIILALEKQFNIEFSLEDIMSIENVGDIVKVMSKYID